jgi:hypothetical protein
VTQRTRAIDAVDVLNDLIGDLITGVMVLRVFLAEHQRRKLSTVQMIGVQKMCLSYLALALCKCMEFWKKYHNIVPTDHRAEYKSLVGKITKNGVESLRNKCVGHIWDRDKKRPLKHSEVMQHLLALAHGAGLPAFLNWVNNPADNTYPNTVVSIVETVRDRIASEYSISGNEIVNR